MVELNSLKSEKNVLTKIVKINNKDISIKQYLPVQEKLNLISRVLNYLLADSDYNFVNPIKTDVIGTVEIIKAYTNIQIAADALPYEVYDFLEKEGITNAVIKNIPEGEYLFINKGIEDMVKSYYAYTTSVLGVLEAMSRDYSSLNLDADTIKDKIADPENLTLIKNIVDKMG